MSQSCVSSLPLCQYDNTYFLPRPLVSFSFLPDIFSSSLFITQDVYDVAILGKGFLPVHFSNAGILLFESTRVCHHAPNASRL